MSQPTNKIEDYRKKYPKGTRLRLTKRIKDPYTSKEVGDILTVDYIDDAGQIHGAWKSGGSIAIIIGLDNFEVVS